MQKSNIDRKEYEALLKTTLTCPHCDQEIKTMPKLSTHLALAWKRRVDEHNKSHRPPSGPAASTEIIDVDALDEPPNGHPAESGTKRKRGGEEVGESADQDSGENVENRPVSDHPAKRQQTDPVRS